MTYEVPIWVIEIYDYADEIPDFFEIFDKNNGIEELCNAEEIVSQLVGEYLEKEVLSKAG